MNFGFVILCEKEQNSMRANANVTNPKTCYRFARLFGSGLFGLMSQRERSHLRASKLRWVGRCVLILGARSVLSSTSHAAVFRHYVCTSVVKGLLAVRLRLAFICWWQEESHVAASAQSHDICPCCSQGGKLSLEVASFDLVHKPSQRELEMMHTSTIEMMY
jgi:hypothetical protein